MSSLTPFSFDSHEIRVLTIAGDPWFVAKDVAEALEYSDSSLETIGKLIAHVPSEWVDRKRIPVPEEWKGVNPIHTPGGAQELWCLSEPGLYFFINRSDKPKALPFQKWAAGEVFPAIRKTGGYALPGAQPAPTDIAALAQQLADLLKGKVVVDYDSLCRFARMGRAAVARLVEVEKLLDETERVGLELEKQCGHPLIRLDMPAERLARHRAAPPRRATAPPDPWEPQVRAYAADRQEVISAEVLRHLGIEDGDQTQTQKNRIANILKNLGFVGYVVHRGGRVHRVWQRHHHG